MLKVFILRNEDFASNFIFSGVFEASDLDVFGGGFMTSLPMRKNT